MENRGTIDFETWCKNNNKEYLLEEWDYKNNDLKFHMEATKTFFGYVKKDINIKNKSIQDVKERDALFVRV